MPEQYRVDLTYRLAGPFGRTPDTHRTTWYFDLPVVAWDELLQRVSYDANVGRALAKLYPNNGTSVFADRQQRMANLVAVRPTTSFRRVPGSTPFVSGPVTP